ncbi:MAG: carbamoyl phosphate synthase, partial [Actinomycetota bacterium]|nr:carbamoyl phosphate synthase [Actinomycetota bacterium]
DPLFAKLIVRGANREDALGRLRRALAEFRIEGIATTLPFFEAILEDEVFVKGSYTTGFIAERLGGLEIKGQPGAGGADAPPGAKPEKEAREVEVEVNGKLFRVKVYGDEAGTVGGTGDAKAPPARRSRERGRGADQFTEGTVVAPMQGTILKVFVEEGQEVAVDDPMCLLEAMKMESEVRARRDGVVSEVLVEAGKTVRSGDPLVVLE